MFYINYFDGKYTPRLAESYEVQDKNTWKFNLRKGVKFHNGDAVTAEDEKFSFERTMGKFNKNFAVFAKGPWFVRSLLLKPRINNARGCWTNF